MDWKVHRSHILDCFSFVILSLERKSRVDECGGSMGAGSSKLVSV